MVVTENSFISATKLSSYLFVRKTGRNFATTLAKKRDSSEASRTQKKPSFPLRVSNTLLAQSAIALFGLGFIDAGYSGDWSRIGVISKESEELLKVAAFVVAPLCLFLVLYFSKNEEA
ncbi:hypothetical protein FNV43_RR03346 [Rhamnella rubrinervis]|uniref:DUF7887 domain-containing protein n=1 Tax=Rhamnella rubrinervis TaxID=2594499 RepID=A0A8K0HIZ3_9ROSA|nr:hypothetical protein FNV43_RR03346 [Rhamnella rubrinervis]